MKKFILLLIVAFSWIFLPAQMVQWTWVSGDSTSNNVDVYGNKRMLDPVNKPGSLLPLGTWTDKGGNFYMFGGTTLGIRFGFDTIPVFTNALWKYSPFVNAWAMVTGANSTIPATSGGGVVFGTPGVPAPGNTPDILEYMGATSMDTSGNWWLFGGKTGFRDFGTKCQLWKFDPVIGQWTYLCGNSDDTVPSYGAIGVPASSATPGARMGAAMWNDRDGHIYLYGGYCQRYYSSYGDVWKYDQAANIWTWVSGRQWSFGLVDGPVYGTQGVFAVGNTPGAGQGSILAGPDSVGIISLSITREVWNFSLKTNQWAWISGDRTATPPPSPQRNYGTKGVPSATNSPGPRAGAVTWKDDASNLWTFGGSITYVKNGISLTGYLNDLWKYTPATNQWVWVEGDSSVDRRPDFGTKGVFAPTNQPGGRSGSAIWKDTQGNVWLFGGNRLFQRSASSNSSVSVNTMNDVWKLSIKDVAVPVKLSSLSAIQKNEQIVLHWNTSQEQNSKAFIVQRSPDGIHFTPIGTVVAAGNASIASWYQFTDDHPLQGNNFYRLEQISLDNTLEYSSLTKVFVETAGLTYRIMQNPVPDKLILVLKTNQEENVLVQVNDATGYLIIKKNITIAQGVSTYTLPVEQLAAGAYSITIIKDKKVITKHFLKQ